MKIRTFYIILTFLSLALFKVHGQQPNFASRPGAITVVKYRGEQEKKNKTHCYISNVSFPGNIVLFSGDSIRNRLINYDFNLDAVELKISEDSVGYIPGHQVKEFSFVAIKNSPKYVNGARYSGSPYPVKIYQILAIGKIELVKGFRKEVLQSNYNVVLDVGDKRSKSIVKKKLYYYSEKSLVELRKSKRAILKLFTKKKDEVEDFIKTQNLSVKKEDDLILIFNYYNQLS